MFRAAGCSVAELDVDGAVVRQRGQVPLGGGPGNSDPPGHFGRGILLAGFQRFQHGRLGGGARLGGRRDVAGDQRTLGALHRVLVERAGLGQDPPVPGIGTELLGQRLGRERLQQVAQGAAPEGGPERDGVRRRAQDHGVHIQLPEQVKARAVGQIHIQQHQVRAQAVDGLQRLRRRTCRRQRQEACHRIHVGRVQLGDVEVVVHDQHPEILSHR